MHTVGQGALSVFHGNVAIQLPAYNNMNNCHLYWDLQIPSIMLSSRISPNKAWENLSFLHFILNQLCNVLGGNGGFNELKISQHASM